MVRNNVGDNGGKRTWDAGLSSYALQMEEEEDSGDEISSERTHSFAEPS